MGTPRSGGQVARRGTAAVQIAQRLAQVMGPDEAAELAFANLDDKTMRWIAHRMVADAIRDPWWEPGRDAWGEPILPSGYDARGPLGGDVRRGRRRLPADPSSGTEPMRPPATPLSVVEPSAGTSTPGRAARPGRGPGRSRPVSRGTGRDDPEDLVCVCGFTYDAHVQDFRWFDHRFAAAAPQPAHEHPAEQQQEKV